jgi:hypothetical protein
MSKEFEMSMMGELQFFLGLQIKQAKEGNLCTSSQVHEGHPQEVQDGRFETPINTDEYDYSA